MASETMKTVQKVDKKNDKNNANKPKDKKNKPNVFKRFARYVKEVIAELKRVSWPTRKETVSATGQVLLFVAAMAVLVFVLDFGFGKLIELILTIGA